VGRLIEERSSFLWPTDRTVSPKLCRSTPRVASNTQSAQLPPLFASLRTASNPRAPRIAPREDQPKQPERDGNQAAGLTRPAIEDEAGDRSVRALRHQVDCPR